MRRISGSILAFALAGIVTSACTSAETSTSITSPSSDKCQFDVTNAPSAFAASGGQGAVTITTSRDCAWSLRTDAGWVAAASATGQGDATVAYSVAANTVPSERIATITAGGQTVQLRQAAAPCRYELSRGSDSIGSGGGSLAVSIATLTGCAWTASSDASWLTITSGQSGNAAGMVGLLVAGNNGPVRLGHVVAGGQTYTVTQDAASSAEPPAPPMPPPPDDETTTRVEGRIVLIWGQCPDVTFIVRTATIVADSSTEYRKGNCGDLRIGRDVDVDGTIQPSQTVRATRIEVKK